MRILGKVRKPEQHDSGSKVLGMYTRSTEGQRLWCPIGEPSATTVKTLLGTDLHCIVAALDTAYLNIWTTEV